MIPNYKTIPARIAFSNVLSSFLVIGFIVDLVLLAAFGVVLLSKGGDQLPLTGWLIAQLGLTAVLIAASVIGTIGVSQTMIFERNRAECVRVELAECVKQLGQTLAYAVETAISESLLDVTLSNVAREKMERKMAALREEIQQFTASGVGSSYGQDTKATFFEHCRHTNISYPILMPAEKGQTLYGICRDCRKKIPYDGRWSVGIETDSRVKIHRDDPGPPPPIRRTN